MAEFGITENGFVLKRLFDIISDMDAELATVQDPVTGETLDLDDENDPLNQIKNSVADQLAVCWEALEMAYNQFDPLKASGAGLSGLVQLNGVLRQLDEVDTALRLRQQGETTATAYRQVDAIYSALIAIPGVKFARVYQNSTIDVDERGIPAKSIAPVVVGGDDEAIAEAIFGRTAVGISYHGNTMTTCFDAQGFPYDIYFVRPVEVEITVEITIGVYDVNVWPADGVQQIKDSVVAFAQYGLEPNRGLPPGAELVCSRFYSPVNAVFGHKIEAIRLARGGAEPDHNNIDLLWNEVGVFTADNVVVNVL